MNSALTNELDRVVKYHDRRGYLTLTSLDFQVLHVW